MTQEEFTTALKTVDSTIVGANFTERQWKLIETVYTYHPSINDKEHMAYLYLNYGMAAITDMYYRAVKIRDMERSIHDMETNLERMNRLYDEFDNSNSIAVPWEDNV